MNRTFKVIVLILLSVPLVAAAYGRGYGGWHGGYGWRGPGWGFGYGVGLGLAVGAPYYYGYPGYYYPYGGPYYGYGYGYYPPPVYAPPVVEAQQPPAAYWYYCPPARAYFPYVRECPTGWQAVPARGQPRAARAPMPAPAGRVTYSLGDVLFATGKSDLRPAAVSTLDTLLASISKEPNRHLVVEGYTDSVGSASSNLALSQRRADAVMQYLVAHGIELQRISASGKGEADPVDSNATAKGRRHNRRVNVVVE